MCGNIMKKVYCECMCAMYMRMCGMCMIVSVCVNVSVCERICDCGRMIMSEYVLV